MARPSKQLQPLLHEVGQPQTQLVIANFLQDAQQRDLQMPARLCTYDAMARDDAVYTASTVTSLDVIKALANGLAVGRHLLVKSMPIGLTTTYRICLTGLGIKPV